ncbi:MAG: ABC transporter ATP-binding protein, partial [Candidatus Dormibacteraeota bacterium]|nr:ABC transporter ATP-binding protein [Candidatus Dormibacteraeota bacterium]
GQVRERYGTTIVLTTHYLEEAEGAEAVCVLARGRVVEQGTPAELKARLSQGELWVDARDRGVLRRELAAMGLQVLGEAPLRVQLDGRSAQSVVRALESELTVLRVVEPSLEEAYLTLLEGDPS